MINTDIAEKILEIFRNNDETLQLAEIAKLLHIRSDSNDYTELKAALAFLCEQKTLAKSARRRYSLNLQNQFNDFSGELVIEREKAYVITNNEQFPIIYIRSKDYNTAFNGDTVRVKIKKLKDTKITGNIIDVLDRKIDEFSGVLDEQDGDYYIVPDDKKIYVDFKVSHKKLNGAMKGDKIVAKFVSWKNENMSPIADIIQVMGQSGVASVEFDSIIQEFDLPKGFPEQVVHEAERYSVPKEQNEYPDRMNLIDEDIITIDPFDAKDFDDALSLKILDNGNYYLGVHIADVSFYVKEGTALDTEAKKRGNSIYLTDRVIPMLPEELSNVVCSLNPKEIRYAFSCFMEIGKMGAVKDYHITPSVIKSKRRFTYEEALEIIETGEGDYANLIVELHRVASMLRKKRFRTGGIDFKTSEIKFRLDENRFPIEALKRTTTKSTSLVEECMLLANQTVARHVKSISKKWNQPKTLPYVYRIHDEPEPSTMRPAIEFVQSLGVKLQKKTEYKSKDINDILHSFSGKGEEELVNQVLIRSMPKAVYSIDNMGHFGLGFSDYTHFTSPIRRYPDLLIHRLLREYAAKEPTSERVNILTVDLKSSCDHCSSTERLAMEAERASNKLAHTLMMKSRVGEIFEGTISGVTAFGLFVIMDDVFSEGLLHIKDLTDDYYYFDEKQYRLRGRRKKKELRIGDKITVQVAKVNIDKRNIDLVVPPKSKNNSDYNTESESKTNENDILID